MVWKAVRGAVTAWVVLFVLTLLAGQILGQPILLGYVVTGSMAPTLEAGDGFVAIPDQLSGEITEGDVVVFRATEVDGGGLTTRRVVDVTEEGFVTNGDASPSTDRDADEPPVGRSQVVATAWQPGGELLVIPGLGTAVSGTRSALRGAQRLLAATLGTRSPPGARGLASLLLALAAVAYVLDLWVSDGGDQRPRDRTR